MALLSEVKKIKDNYENTILIEEGLEFSQPDTIKKIIYYSHSQYLTGNEDEFGAKPFYNIVNFRVNVAARATDIDTKDINFVPEEPEWQFHSLIFKKEIDNWMQDQNFSKTLNKMTETRPRYGGVLVKKTERAGELSIDTVNWINTITDQVDIEGGAKIEKHFLSIVDLQKKKAVWDGLADNWDEILKLRFQKEKTKTGFKTFEGRIPVLEVEGEFPETYVNEEGDEDKYTLQLHYIAGDEEGKQYILHSEELKETRYKYLPWEEVDNRGLGRGIIEDGFESQMAVNDSILKQQQINEFASKILFTTDDNTLENNVLTDVDNGHIFHLSEGRSMGMLNTMPNSIPALQSYIQDWDTQLERATSTFNAITGETMPSGTPFRQAAILNQEASSIFDYRREQMGIFIREIMNDWIIPHVLKKVNKEHILASDYSETEIKLLAEEFTKYRSTEEAHKRSLQGDDITYEKYEEIQKSFRDLIINQGETQFLRIPDNYFQNAKMKVKVITTGEQRNKAVTFESLNNILQVVASNPQILQNEGLYNIFARIVEMSGLGFNASELRSQVAGQQEEQQPPEVTNPNVVEENA